jgi:NAD(P)H-dependent FMN reductase
MKVLLIDGSPAVKSHTHALLGHLEHLFKQRGAETEIITLKEWQLPYNDPALHDRPWDHPHEGVRSFAKKVEEADIVVLGSPLYHGTFSGLLKTALDHLTDDGLKGKKVLPVSNASGLRGSIQAAQQLVIAPRTMGGQVHPRLIGTAKPDYDERPDGYVLVAPDMLQRCQEIVEEITSKGDGNV